MRSVTMIVNGYGSSGTFMKISSTAKQLGFKWGDARSESAETIGQPGQRPDLHVRGDGFPTVEKDMGIWIQQDYFRHGTCCSSIYKELIDRIARHGKKDPGPWLGVLLLDPDDAIAGLWEPAWNPMATCTGETPRQAVWRELRRRRLAPTGRKSSRKEALPQSVCGCGRV